jgi:ribosome biogenesis protein Nip4
MSIVLVGNGSVKIRIEKASHELIEEISRNKKIKLRMHIDSASDFLYSVYRGYL